MSGNEIQPDRGPDVKLITKLSLEGVELTNMMAWHGLHLFTILETWKAFPSMSLRRATLGSFLLSTVLHDASHLLEPSGFVLLNILVDLQAHPWQSVRHLEKRRPGGEIMGGIQVKKKKHFISHPHP